MGGYSKLIIVFILLTALYEEHSVHSCKTEQLAHKYLINVWELWRRGNIGGIKQQAVNQDGTYLNVNTWKNIAKPKNNNQMTLHWMKFYDNHSNERLQRPHDSVINRTAVYAYTTPYNKSQHYWDAHLIRPQCSVHCVCLCTWRVTRWKKKTTLSCDRHACFSRLCLNTPHFTPSSTGASARPHDWLLAPGLASAWRFTGSAAVLPDYTV